MISYYGSPVETLISTKDTAMVSITGKPTASSSQFY